MGEISFEARNHYYFVVVQSKLQLHFIVVLNFWICQPPSVILLCSSGKLKLWTKILVVGRRLGSTFAKYAFNYFNLVGYDLYQIWQNLNIPSPPKAKSFASSIPSNSLTLIKLASTNYLSLTKFKKSLDIVIVLHLMNYDSNSTCNFMSLNFSSSSTSWIIKCAICTVFLLKAFATTFAFSEWYKSSKS